MFFLLLVSILLSYFANPIPLFADVPPVIPGSINTNKLFTGSYDSQYPNTDFVPNDPSGASCEFTISGSQAVPTGDQSPTGTPAPIVIHQTFGDQNINAGPRILNTNLYELSPCDPSNTQDYATCIAQRNTSMDTSNYYGASSPVQRMLSQSQKNKLYCSRWNSGIISGNQVMDTDELVGCYCGGDSSSTIISGNCPDACRDVYFSELALSLSQDMCHSPPPQDISDYYNCSAGTCPFYQRVPKAKDSKLAQITDIVAQDLIKNASIVPKGSVATRVSQETTNNPGGGGPSTTNSSVGVIPFLMAPSSIESQLAIKNVIPASQQAKIPHSNCTPVATKAGPDKYKFDFIAAIIAFFTGGSQEAQGETTIKQDYSSGTISGLDTASALNTLVQQKELDKNPSTTTQYTKTSDNNQNSIFVPNADLSLFTENLTPNSWHK